MRKLDIKKYLISICAVCLIELYRMSFSMSYAKNGIELIRQCYGEVHFRNGSIDYMRLSVFVFWHLVVFMTFGTVFYDDIMKNADIIFTRNRNVFKLLLRKVCINFRHILIYEVIILIPYIVVCSIKGIGFGSDYFYLVLIYLYIIEITTFVNVLSIHIGAVYSILFCTFFSVFCVFLRDLPYFSNLIPVSAVMNNRTEAYFDLFIINFIYFFIITASAFCINRKEVF